MTHIDIICIDKLISFEHYNNQLYALMFENYYRMKILMLLQYFDF